MKRIPTLVTGGLVTLFSVLPATASALSSKQVVFKETSGACEQGELSGNPTQSVAVFTSEDGPWNIEQGTVTVTVRLRGLTPDATYQLDLVQTPAGRGCLKIPGQTEVTTNSLGNASARLSQTIRHGQTGAFVMLFPPENSLEGILATPGVPLA